MLEQRTEGWIVGLHLAALLRQSHSNAADFTAQFTGSHANPVDYLTEEVLQRQPAEIQQFLFQTAWLSRLPERELEVLQWVDASLTDSQVAAKLIPAVGTVKRHLNNI